MSDETQYAPWFEEDKERIADAIHLYVKTLEDQSRNVAELHLRCAWLYNQCFLNGDYELFHSSNWEDGPVTENIVESVIDTATSMIAKNRPRPTFMTDGANWKTQRRAHYQGRFLEAEAHRLELYDKGVRTFRDGGVLGTGGVQIYAHKGKACVDRVLIDEIRVDERLCRHGPLREIHRIRSVDLKTLIADYPDHAEEIQLAGRGSDDRVWSSMRRLETNEIVVIESWRLGPDGRHVLSIEGHTLLDEAYEKEYFPFAWFRWSERMVGFYGRGLAEQLAGIQLRINTLNRFIQRCQDLVAVPRVFVPLGDAGLKVKITNDIGQIIPFRVAPPTFVTPPAVPAEIYQYKEQLKASAYQMAGISELSAQSKKPADLESAVALREFNDIETQRFSIQAQRLEAWYLEVFRQLIVVYKEISEDDDYETPTAIWKTNNAFKLIRWDEVDEEEDVYSMTLEASSILSRTPAGRLAAVVEMAQSGMIDGDEARRLLNHPDVDRALSLYNAAIEDAEALIEQLLEGNFEAPEPFQSLKLCLKRVTMAYLKAKREKAPEDILEGFRDWMDLCAQMLKPPPAPPQSAMAPPEPALPAGPAPQLALPPPGAAPLAA